MSKINRERRQEALDTLEHLSRHLKAIDADIVFEALKEQGFDEIERVQLTGAIMRSASAKGWIARTDYSVRSKKNHSNLQSVWCSLIFKKAKDGAEIPDAAVKREYERWESQGFTVHHLKAMYWEREQQAKPADYRAQFGWLGSEWRGA